MTVSPMTRHKLSTWIGPGMVDSYGNAGVTGKDLTEALAWVTKNKEHISSLSIIGYGKPGAQNVRSPPPQARVQAHAHTQLVRVTT